jgi:hypothetical protein
LTLKNHHGQRFQKALLSLIKRAIREFRKEIPEDDVFWNRVKVELESITFAKMDWITRGKRMNGSVW